MRLLSSAILAVLAASAATADAASTEYPACTTQQTQQYFSALSNELSQCQKTSTYDFTAGVLPSLDQRSAVCKCTPLIKQLPNIRVPRCKIRLDGNAYKFTDAITSIFAECGSITVVEEPLPKSGSGSGEVAGAEADATPAVTTNSTTAPPMEEASSSSSSGSNDTSIETVPEPTTKPVTQNQATEAPEETTTTPAPTTAAPTSSAMPMVELSMAAGLVVTATALLTV